MAQVANQEGRTHLLTVPHAAAEWGSRGPGEVIAACYAWWSIPERTEQPTIYEINTVVWLNDLGCGLGEVPAAEWDRIAALAFDAVWLMGVWERGPGGSPYCIRRYVADERLGGPAGLSAARQALAARGMRLLLDYVPNHVAPTHPWVTEHPDYLIAGDEIAGRFAFGREQPASAPWSDVVQVNAFHPGVRAAALETLSAIATCCDGVRCDMAMLVLTDIFARNWGHRAGPAPGAEYWTEMIGAVRKDHPDFVFVAEAYWDTEWRLMQLGFDFCYDKVLCDRLISGDAAAIRAHLGADPAYQRRLLRFIENHDEARSAAVMAPGRLRAAAVAIATLPGAALYYEGQFEGRRVRIPVAESHRPTEPVDTVLLSFYQALLPAARELRGGDWQLAAVTGRPDNDSSRRLVGWARNAGDAFFVVVINFGEEAAQGRIHVDVPCAERCAFTDLLSGVEYPRRADEIRQNGLYVDLPPYGCHLLRAAI